MLSVFISPSHVDSGSHECVQSDGRAGLVMACTQEDEDSLLKECLLLE